METFEKGNISHSKACAYRGLKLTVPQKKGGCFHINENGKIVWEEDFLPLEGEEVQINGESYFLASVPADCKDEAEKILTGRKETSMKFFTSAPFEVSVVARDEEHDYEYRYSIDIVIFAVSKPSISFKNKRWALVGLKDFINLSTSLYTENSSDQKKVLSLLDNTGKYFCCDHCGVKRDRNIAAVVKSEDGEFAVLGSSCLEEYTGQGIINKLQRLNEFLKELRGSFERYQKEARVYHADELIGWTLWAMAEYGYSYISKKVDAIQSTTNQLYFISAAPSFDKGSEYTGKFVPFSDLHPELDEQVPEKYINVAKDILESLYNEIREENRYFSDYEQNVRTCFEYRKENRNFYITERKFGFLGCIAKDFMEGKILADYQCDFRKVEAGREFVGNKGDKIKVSGKIIKCQEFEQLSYNGRYTERKFRYEMIDNDHNLYSFELNKNVNLGQAEIQAKVKDHKEYSGKKINKLFYVKVLKSEPKQEKAPVWVNENSVDQAMDKFMSMVEA